MVIIKSIIVALDYHLLFLVKDQLIKKHLIFDCWFFLVTPSKMPYISIQNLESMNQKKLGK